MKNKNLINLIILICVFYGFYLFKNSNYPCDNLKKTYINYELNIIIETISNSNKNIVISGKNQKNILETFCEGDSYLFHKKYLFSKGDTLIKKKDELFFELRKFGTGEKKIIEITCK